MTAPGNWIKMPNPGPSDLSKVRIAVSALDKPADDEWHAAGHEAGFVMIRMPRVPPGHYSIWSMVDDGPPVRHDAVMVG